MEKTTECVFALFSVNAWRFVHKYPKTNKNRNVRAKASKEEVHTHTHTRKRNGEGKDNRMKAQSGK